MQDTTCTSSHEAIEGESMLVGEMHLECVWGFRVKQTLEHSSSQA